MTDETKWLKEILNKIDSRQDEHAVTLARLASSVEEHIRRTNILEEEFKPVRAHVTFVNMGARFVLGLIPMAGLLKAFNVF